jgi:O-antigen/teichoic acid export membrane protein
MIKPAPKPDMLRKKPKENLKQRAYLNSVTSMLDYGAHQITVFIVNPFLVSGLGNTLYGVWQMLGQMTGYANLTDTRATQVLKWTVAKNRNIASEDELRSYVTSTLIVTAFILPLALLAGGIISWYAPSITGVSEEYFTIVRLTSAILILSLVINKVFNIFESVLRGMNLGYKRMGLRASIVLMGGGLKIGVILLGYGLIGLSAVQVLVAIITGVTLYFVVKKNIGWFGFGKTNSRNIIDFSKLSGWFMAWTGVNMLLINSDKIILGIIAGPAVVTMYAITKFTSMAIQGVVSNTVHGVIPGIGGLIGKEDFKKAANVREQIMILTWLLGTALGAVILLYNESFVGLWVGEEHFAGHTVNMLIVLMILQFIFIQNDGAIINVTLNMKMKVLLALVSAIISIGLSILLINNYGIAGLCISIIAGRLLLTFGYPYLVNRFINDNIFLLSKILRPIITSILFFIFCYLVADMININNWIYLIVAIVFSFILFGVLSWFSGLKVIQRKKMYHIVNHIKFIKSM